MTTTDYGCTYEIRIQDYPIRSQLGKGTTCTVSFMISLYTAFAILRIAGITISGGRVWRNTSPSTGTVPPPHRVCSGYPCLAHAHFLSHQARTPRSIGCPHIPHRQWVRVFPLCDMPLAHRVPVSAHPPTAATMHCGLPLLVGTSENERRHAQPTEPPAARLCALEAADTGTEQRLPCGSTDVVEQRADGLETRSHFDRGEPSTYGPRRPTRAEQDPRSGHRPAHTAVFMCGQCSHGGKWHTIKRTSAGAGFGPWQTVGECCPPSRSRLWQPGGGAHNDDADGPMPMLRYPSMCPVLRFCTLLLTDSQPDQLTPRFRRIL